MLARTGQIQEESLWFGADQRPFFGRLTTPEGDTCRGGVLLSSPIGRESRLARRALRRLAISLAIDGYVSLRFDHFGTGDSSGTMEDEEVDRAWVEGVGRGVALLRSLGVSSVSAVGMRLGATIVGTAAASLDLGLSSFVMWDPCESGRSYVRELLALGAVHPDPTSADKDSHVQMLEYALSEKAADRLNKFDLGEATPSGMAERVLVITRDDRAASRNFQARWDAEGAEWATTSEQESLLEPELPSSVPPVATIALIAKWLTSPSAPQIPFSVPPDLRKTVVLEGPDSPPVRETVLNLGFRKLFAIASEPVGDAQGPYIVMVNGVNEDHVGPARLWVELSRRWASWGLRCVRFDLDELGESPWDPSNADRPVFDRTLSQDVGDAVRALSHEDPSNSVLVGYCSGAPLAMTVAKKLRCRGVCAINPGVGAGVFRNVRRVENSDRESVRWFMRGIETLRRRHRRVDQLIQRTSRLLLSSAFAPKVSPALIAGHSHILLVLSPEDLSPLRQNPLFDYFLRRRLVPSDYLHIEIVPEMDHAILSTLGRSRLVAVLDRHVAETFLHDSPPSDTGRTEARSL